MTNPGQFKPGVSGNPAGKPRGVRNRATQLAEKLMEADARQIVAQVVASALAGDMTAARMVLDRIAPTPRDRRIEIDLPTVATAGDVDQAQATVLAQVAAGELRPSEGQAMSDLIENRRRAIETSELAERIGALERKLTP